MIRRFTSSDSVFACFCSLGILATVRELKFEFAAWLWTRRQFLNQIRVEEASCAPQIGVLRNSTNPDNLVTSCRCNRSDRDHELDSLCTCWHTVLSVHKVWGYKTGLIGLFTSMVTNVHTESPHKCNVVNVVPLALYETCLPYLTFCGYLLWHQGGADASHVAAASSPSETRPDSFQESESVED